MKIDDDDLLMRKMAMGDETAFEHLFKRYSSRVLGYAQRILQNLRLAEDVSQDVWVKVVTAAPKYDARGEFSSWLMTIVRNSSFAELRKKKSRIQEISTDDQLHNTSQSMNLTVNDFEDLFTTKSNLVILRKHINELPDLQRTVLAIWMTEELSYEDIADTIGTTVSAVKSALFRAKRSLEISLKEVI